MTTKIHLKTPITYYGGKQQMLRIILPLIPNHKIYTEAFFGGGALFFAKEPSDVEIINDSNSEVSNFYKILKTRYAELQSRIEQTLHSRREYADSMIIYENPHLFNEMERAAAFYILTNQGWGSKIGSWGYSVQDNKTSLKDFNKKRQFTDEYSNRLNLTQIENNDVIKVIQSRDTEDTFHYLDPPYLNCNQGHYSGYTLNDFEQLLTALTSIKGKFLMSSYPEKILEKYVEDNGWYSVSIVISKSVSNKIGAKKTEVLTANYPININQESVTMNRIAA